MNVDETPYDIRLEMKPAFHLIGERQRTSHADNEENQTVPKLMERFYFTRMAEVRHRVNEPDFYGVLDFSEDRPESGNYAWIAAAETSGLEHIPDGMVGRTYPTLLYAVAVYRGTGDGLPDVFEYMYHTWLPRSGYEIAGPFAFQLYGMQYHGPVNPESVVEVYFPIKPPVSGTVRPNTLARPAVTEAARAAFEEAPPLLYDGAGIDVLMGNHEEAIRWFERYCGWKTERKESWKPDPRALEGRMTHMGWGTWLVSALSETKLPHHYADRGTLGGHVRWCWKVGDLDRLAETFKQDGVRAGGIYRDPMGVRSLDCWATSEGIRITVQEDRDVDPAAFVPSYVRIGVRRLDSAIEWYRTYMGMKLAERKDDEGYALLSLGVNHRKDDVSLWVLEQLSDPTPRANMDPPVRPYCFIASRERFFAYHAQLRSAGVETSDIGGFAERGLVAFHFYDPDGNRMNVSSF